MILGQPLQTGNQLAAERASPIMGCRFTRRFLVAHVNVDVRFRALKQEGRGIRSGFAQFNSVVQDYKVRLELAALLDHGDERILFFRSQRAGGKHPA
jgi:hypothetical protein